MARSRKLPGTDSYRAGARNLTALYMLSLLPVTSLSFHEQLESSQHCIVLLLLLLDWRGAHEIIPEGPIDNLGTISFWCLVCLFLFSSGLSTLGSHCIFPVQASGPSLMGDSVPELHLASGR